MKDEMLDLFFYWINERHWIYLQYKVDKEPWPWTKDSILQTYSFTNVFRENDTGTIWLRENWLEPYANHAELFFNICLYRQFNWLETAGAVGYTEDWNPDKVAKKLHKRKDDGHRIFTNAHMLTGTLGGDKISQVVYKILTPLWEDIETYEPHAGDTLEASFKRICSKAKGFGPFLSYEVVTDLRHTRYLRDAEDIMTWANPGPGAMRGINRIHGLPAIKKKIPGRPSPVNKAFKKQEYIDIMQDLLEISSDYLEEHVPALEMRDIEHSLCEFDKYCRVKFGEGRPRMRYNPPLV